MPKLSCRSCGRQIYTVAPLEALFAEERRCPRCGAFLHDDRRAAERRLIHRRLNPPNDPGPPKPKPKPKPKATPAPAVEPVSASGSDDGPEMDDGERRRLDRRSKQRRGGGTAKPSASSTDSGGWRD